MTRSSPNSPVRLARELTPPEQDRWMQVFLAQARGPIRNGDLLRAAVARAIKQRAVRDGMEVNSLMNDPLIETLTAVADALESLGIRYAITGSVASSVHGEPFDSIDADLILIALPSHAAALSQALAPRFYAPEDMLVGACKSGGFINVIDIRTTMKVDLSFVGGDPFLRQCLDRRVRAQIGGHPRQFWFVTPEDIILMKLLWRKDTQSAKQWENALSVARFQGARMDWAYLFDQAKSLRIEDDLIRLRDDAGI